MNAVFHDYIDGCTIAKISGGLYSERGRKGEAKRIESQCTSAIFLVNGRESNIYIVQVVCYMIANPKRFRTVLS